MRRLAILAAAALALLAAPAEAHIVSARLGDFYAGALHPLTGLEDLVQWLALGLLAGSQPPERARWVVPAFPLGLLLGVLLMRSGHGWPALPLVDAAGMVLLGALLALAAAVPGAALAGLAALLGVLRGGANTSDLGDAADPTLFACGLLLSGYAVATLAGGGAMMFRRLAPGWPVIALRACGSWIVAVGLMFATFNLHLR